MDWYLDGNHLHCKKIWTIHQPLVSFTAAWPGSLLDETMIHLNFYTDCMVNLIMGINEDTMLLCITNAVLLVFLGKSYCNACYGDTYNLEAINFLVDPYSTVTYIIKLLTNTFRIIACNIAIRTGTFCSN